MCKTKMMHFSEETAVSSSVVRQIENCEDDKKDPCIYILYT